MQTATITAILDHIVDDVWRIVTDNQNYHWRSDCFKIDVVDELHFCEYTEDGFRTDFTITTKIAHQRYEFALSNKNMRGTWIGIFEESGNTTKITFTECISVKNPIMKLFVKSYLKKQQNIYLSDLKKALEAL